MEAELVEVLARVLGLDERAVHLVDPVVEAGQQEAQRRPLRKARERGDLVGRAAAHRAVARDHEARLGHVEAEIGLEAPGVEADGEVVDQRVVAGEVEVDQAAEPVALEEDVVGEEVGVDHAARQVARPFRVDAAQRGRDLGREPRRHVVGARAAALEQRPPAIEGERVGALRRVVEAGEVQPRQRLAERRALVGPGAPGPDAGEEARDRRRPAAEPAQHRAVPPVDRNRAGHAARRQVLDQAEEEGQVGFGDALLVEREDVGAAPGQQDVVRVLDPFGDALEGEDRADVVVRDERGKLVV